MFLGIYIYVCLSRRLRRMRDAGCNRNRNRNRNTNRNNRNGNPTRPSTRRNNGEPHEPPVHFHPFGFRPLRSRPTIAEGLDRLCGSNTTTYRPPNPSPLSSSSDDTEFNYSPMNNEECGSIGNLNDEFDPFEVSINVVLCML